ncbi:MAG: hypothetical protein SGBAC_000278 [Bacillariaceae sp.]
MPEFNPNTFHGRKGIISQIAAKISVGSELSAEDLGGLKQFLSGGASSQLPSLDKDFVKRQIDGIQIVHHIGMVQNMLDPEFYVSSLNGRSLHFRDCNPTPNAASDDTIEDLSNLAERQPLFVVPIPFTTDWFKECSVAKETHIDERSKTAEPITASTPRKRERETDHSKNSKHRSEEAENIDRMNDSDVSAQEECPKRSVEWWPAGCKGSDASSSPILAKFYYDQYSQDDKKCTSLRLNDIVETIGVLSMNPWEADFSTPGSNFEFDSPPPPPSQLPRLHVLAYRTIELDALSYEKVLTFTETTPRIMRSALDSGLKRSLAAQAIFLTMLSKAERRDGLIHRMSASAVGCASLKVSTTMCSKEMFRRLKSVLHQSCPIVAAFDLTSSKEQHPFPGKSNGNIAPTSWQLPAGSTLLLHLGDSKHEGLEELLTSHQVAYTFEGGVQIQFEADFRIVIVSNNKKVKCSLQVCCDEEDLSLLEGEERRLRETLALCRRVGNVKLSPEVLERAQGDFLSQRSSARSNPKSRMPDEDDFHRWLCLTRLQARSRGCEIATTEDWEKAFALDDGIWNSRN